MNNNNNTQECTDDNCSTCNLIQDLTLEFGELIADDVPWTNALEYVLRSALATDDEAMDELVKDVYSDGFHDGVIHSLKLAQETLGDIQEGLEDMNDAEPYDKIQFDKDDNDDKIQNIIKQNR